MSSAIELLNQVAARLQQEGKTPSLALFKGRLAGQLSAPALFAAYQQWRNQAASLPDNAGSQHAPDATNLVHATVSPTDNAQLQRIEAKLDKILALLEQHNVSG